MTSSPAEAIRPASLRFDGFGWRPAGRLRSVLSDVCLTVAPGERVLLAGPSGAGKSTLLRAAAGLLQVAGEGDAYGRVSVAGRDSNDPPTAGLVLQDPLDAVVAETVGRDVAFGPENLGLRRSEISARVTAALELVRFPYPPATATRSLSGGELQRLALAGALALRPGLLLLDEPTSMLDAESAAEVRAAIRHVVDLTGCTLLVAEHRIGPWLADVDRIIVLDATGRVVCDDTPSAALAGQAAMLERAGVWLPDLPPPVPAPVAPELVAPRVRASGDTITAEHLFVRLQTRGLRGRREVAALQDVDTTLTAGVVRAFGGASGSGKSTLVAALAGLLRPSGGTVRASALIAAGSSTAPSRWSSRELAQRVGWVPQHPELGFVARNVAAEVAATASAIGVSVDVPALLHAFHIDRLAAVDPYRLSGGEQRRLAVLAALAHRPAVGLLDEPTVGQDRHTWAAVAGWVAASASAGGAVGVATHDGDLVRGLSASTTVLHAGSVAGP